MKKSTTAPMAAALCAGAFTALTVLVVCGLTNSLDTAVTLWAVSLRNETLTALALCATFLGSAPALIGLTALFLLIPRTRRAGVAAAALLLLSASLNFLLKHLVQRPRPPVEHLVVERSLSFPSGHTMNSLVFYGALVCALCLLRGRFLPSAALLGAALVLCIGWSRLYLGVHFLSDIFGGLLAGTAILIFLFCPVQTAANRLLARGPRA